MVVLEQTRPFSDFDHEPLSVSPDVTLLESGSAASLFSTETQQLHDLNESAAFLWRSLLSGRGEVSIRDVLESQGCSEKVVEVFCETAISMWLLRGYVAPARVVRALDAPPLHLRKLAIAGASVRIGIHSPPQPSRSDLALAAEALKPLDEAFSALAIDASAGSGATLNFALVPFKNLVFVLRGRKPQVALPLESLVPYVKGLLTRRVADSLQGNLVFHAAQVSKRGKTILLCGASGAGKSTLAVALASRGYHYGGDDLVCANADGLVGGVPFPATLKPGAWPLLKAFSPDVGRALVHRRGDGQEVKYLVPQDCELPTGRAPSLVLFLRRASCLEPRIEPINALDALYRLLASAYSSNGRFDGLAIQNLSQRLTNALCAELTFDQLNPALDAIDAVVDA